MRDYIGRHERPLEPLETADRARVQQRARELVQSRYTGRRRAS